MAYLFLGVSVISLVLVVVAVVGAQILGWIERAPARRRAALGEAEERLTLAVGHLDHLRAHLKVLGDHPLRAGAEKEVAVALAEAEQAEAEACVLRARENVRACRRAAGRGDLPPGLRRRAQHALEAAERELAAAKRYRRD
jgi:hypothetical protein